jgi:hypothetical protein
MYFSRTKRYCQGYEERYDCTNCLSWVDEVTRQNATFNTVRLAPQKERTMSLQNTTSGKNRRVLILIASDTIQNALDTTETGRLCKHVERDAAQIRTLIVDRNAISEIWIGSGFSKTQLNRLVDVVDRERGEVSRYRRLIRSVVNICHCSTRATVSFLCKYVT